MTASIVAVSRHPITHTRASRLRGLLSSLLFINMP